MKCSQAFPISHWSSGPVYYYERKQKVKVEKTWEEATVNHFGGSAFQIQYLRIHNVRILPAKYGSWNHGMLHTQNHR